MAISSAPRVGCQIYYVPVKVRRPSSRYIKNYKKNIEKKNKRERLHGWVKRGGVGISTDSSAVGDCSPQESILEIQRARAHLTKTRPHMKKLLRGGRALGSDLNETDQSLWTDRAYVESQFLLACLLY